MKLRTTTCAALLAAASITAANASEGGGSGYPNGAEGFFAGAVPPPGTYLLLYGSHYWADTLKTENAPDLDISLHATAVVPRLLHVTGIKVLGADWGMHAILPLVHATLDIPAAGLSKSRNGIGDLTLNPAILSWHTKNFHWATGLDVVVPVGTYDASQPLNIGRNYWTVEPLFAATYISDGGFELSGKFMFDINFENPDTNYRTGNEFHFDYTVAQKFGDWTAGIGGYFYTQVQDDDAPAGTTPMGRGLAFAVGPQIKYDYAGMSFIGKWQHEAIVENRPQGEQFWLKFIMRF